MYNLVDILRLKKHYNYVFIKKIGRYVKQMYPLKKYSNSEEVCLDYLWEDVTGGVPC